MKQCEMPGCVYDNLTKGPFCRNCCAHLSRWSKRETADVVRYRGRINLASHQLDRVPARPVKASRKRAAKKGSK